MNTIYSKILKTTGVIILLGLIIIMGYFAYELYEEKAYIENSLESQITSKITSNEFLTYKDSNEEKKVNLDLETNKTSILDNTINNITQQNKIQTPTQDLLPQKPRSIKIHSVNKESKKPYVAIIMDDIAYPRQLQDLKKLNLTITPSFFPVNPDSPETAKMAKTMPFYMIHLPLEALKPQHSKQKWITTGMDIKDIRSYITTIKKDFPNLAYINNHTGSKFTASFNDMQNLLYVLQEHGIDFVDSRTTPLTAAPKIYEQSARPLLYRNVFLDNEQNVTDITKQIKQTVKIAKKQGYAIAICHPHTATFKALEKAKNTLFKDVELVYVKDLPITKNRPELKISLNNTKQPINKVIVQKPIALNEVKEVEKDKTQNNTSNIQKNSSKIDLSMFEEAQRYEKSEKEKSNISFQDCKKDIVRSFIYGCSLQKEINNDNESEQSTSNRFIEMVH